MSSRRRKSEKSVEVGRQLQAIVFSFVIFFFLPLFSVPVGEQLYVPIYVFFLSVFLLLAFLFIRRSSRFKLFLTPDGVMLFWFAWVVLAILINMYVNDYGLEKLYKLAFNILIFGFVVPRLFLSHELARLFVLYISVASLILCVMLIVTYPISSDRANILEANPIWAGRYSGYASLAAFSYLLTSHSKYTVLRVDGVIRKKANLKYSRFISFFVILVSFLGIVLTGSAGPLLGAVCAVFFLMLVRLNARISLLFVTTFLLVVGLFQFSILDSLFGIEYLERFSGSSMSKRLLEGARSELYTLAIELGSENIGGIGVGGFSDYSWQPYPHNLFLEAYAEWGVSMLILLVVCVGAVVVKITKVARGADWVSSYLGMLFIYALINSMFSGDMSSLKLFFTSGVGIFFYTKRFNLASSKNNS